MTQSPPENQLVPTFWHLDDIDWTEVQRQQNSDGRISVVREKWPIIRPGFLSAYVHYEPGMVVRRHGHRSNHVVFVLGGSGWFGTDTCTPGTHIHVPLGAAFGPIIAGPAGLTCWELSFGEFGGWGDQPELYQEEIATRNITPLPDPPLEIGDWFVDPRGDWGAERSSPKVEGMNSVQLHVDDIAWIEAVREESSDGYTAIVREKSLVALADFASVLMEYSPNTETSRVTEGKHHLFWIIGGGAWFDGRWCPEGTHVELPAGSMIPAIRAGKAGVQFLELTSDV
ncbi:MAG: hypothetical protein WEA11_03150 [Acidimicrobiales bacterium]